MIQAGDKFNRLTAVRFVERNKWGYPLWLFRCDCGRESTKIASNVKIGHVKSCGCLNHQRKAPSLQPGDKFEKLTAISFADRLIHGKYRWLFRCDCGSETITQADGVIRGRVKSCGCLKNPTRPGDVFNNWTAVRSIIKDSGGVNQKWIFRCACGNEKVLHVGSVRSGQSRSCGCLRKPTEDEKRVDRLFKGLKAGAKRRNISVNLEKSDISKLAIEQEWKCIQTGIALDFNRSGKRPFGPTIDRINSDLGYTPDNIQLVCNLYNYCKNEFTDDDVLTFAFALAQHKQNLVFNKLKLRRVA